MNRGLDSNLVIQTDIPPYLANDIIEKGSDGILQNKYFKKIE